ncbi:uncharacterized protein LOC114325419 [Diabrotica virgifera virgifera]|uniref:Uncharacterized protein LOC114325419 n=1 Tax=Diabrotica virgifera virgifera TaxID=50390 RepID=A0A6P7F784_DIAVI|nr:uncharacterized protein LOC114325419 [Diabrotica virgifera virgifera]
MKCFVLFACCVAYISASALNFQPFQSVYVDPCACRKCLEEIWNRTLQLNQNLNSVNRTLNNLTVILEKNVTTEVTYQLDELCKVEENLDNLVATEKNITVVLQAQICNLTDVVGDLEKCCRDMECLEQKVDEQTCILANVKNVALTALNDCVNSSCSTASVGVPA